MPEFENFENQRTASTIEERGRNRKSSYKGNDAFIPMAPSAPHDGEIIEYSPNRMGQPQPNRAAILRREQRIRRTKKYTQKINTGPINPFSDMMLSLGEDGLLSYFRNGIKSILKTLQGLWPSRKKKFTPRGRNLQRRKRRPRNRGANQQRRKQNGNEGKERRNPDRPNRNLKHGSKGRLSKQGKSENQGNSRDESTTRRGNNSNANSKPNPNRNRRRRRRPSPESRAAKPPRKD